MKATIRKMNADGTFTIEPDVKPIAIMPYWYGVTAADLSFDDFNAWKAVFNDLSPTGRLGFDEYSNALRRLGFEVEAEVFRNFWIEQCVELAGVTEEQAGAHLLDTSAAYEIFLRVGVSAKQCAVRLRTGGNEPYFRLYWNQTRMGGRDPGELARPVTLDDAFAALGVANRRSSIAAMAALKAFEQRNGVAVPIALRQLFCRHKIEAAINSCHPNDPCFVPVGLGTNLHRGLREQGLAGDYGIEILTPHQGDHEWFAVFDDSDDDARVYVKCERDDGESWLLTASSVGMFFWDLAQTGLAWYQETNFRGGRRVKKNDIGLVCDPRNAFASIGRAIRRLIGLPQPEV